jgi:hypothetical protein
MVNVVKSFCGKTTAVSMFMAERDADETEP